MWFMCNGRITQFYLPPTHEPYLPLLHSRIKRHRPLAGTHCTYPRRDGQVELAWVAHRELNPDTVIHPSTNRARRKLTSLIETNALPLRHSATKAHRYGYLPSSFPTLDEMRENLDESLFRSSRYNPNHVLHHLLPQPKNNG